MAIEDFTTYTKTDPNSRLTVTGSKIAAARLRRNESVFVYDDKGVDHFDALDVDFEVFQDSAGVEDGRASIGFSDTINDCTAWEPDAVHCEIVDQGSRATAVGPLFFLFRGAHEAADSTTNLSEDTVYYCTLSRAAGSDTVTLKIYSNTSRTTLVDTLTVTGYRRAKYRYAFGMVNRNDGYPFGYTGYFQNMDLKEGPAFRPRLTIY